MWNHKQHTDEFRVAVVELWNKGYSAGYIASRMGVSRNAIIGVIHRIKYTGIEVREGIAESPAGPSKRIRKRAEPSAPKILEEHYKPAPILKPEIVAGDILNITVVDNPRWVSLFDVKKDHCRYTKDGKTFCNDVGFPWCEEHKEIVIKKWGVKEP